MNYKEHIKNVNAKADKKLNIIKILFHTQSREQIKKPCCGGTLEIEATSNYRRSPWQKLNTTKLTYT
jgi:hypothetical protein